MHLAETRGGWVTDCHTEVSYNILVGLQAMII
jgi:hypothetical protein